MSERWRCLAHVRITEVRSTRWVSPRMIIDLDTVTVRRPRRINRKIFVFLNKDRSLFVRLTFVCFDQFRFGSDVSVTESSTDFA